MDLTKPLRIIISRTDSIGDVVLTIPMAGWIKKNYPNSKVIFIGRNYTIPVIRCSKNIDEIISWDLFTSKEEQILLMKKLKADIIFHAFPEKEVVKAAYEAKIPWRVATGRRKHTALTCNKRLWWSRKQSDLHESQLNLKMLSVLGLKKVPKIMEIPSLYGFANIPQLPNTIDKLLASDKINVVLHPKSKGSAVEWGLDNFQQLIDNLPSDKVQIFITGTQAEREIIQDKLPWDKKYLIDLTGKMSLDELVAFLDKVDVVIAGSTGPVHIASALGTKTVGLYSPKRPIHPSRWMPIGKRAHFIVASSHPVANQLDISVSEVVDFILKE